MKTKSPDESKAPPPVPIDIGRGALKEIFIAPSLDGFADNQGYHLIVMIPIS